MIPAISIQENTKISNINFPKKSAISFFPTISVDNTTQMNLPSISFHGNEQRKNKETVPVKEGFPCVVLPLMYIFLILLFEMGNAFSTQWLKTFPFYICPVVSFCILFQGLENGWLDFFIRFILVIVYPLFQSNYFLGGIHLFLMCMVVSFGFWKKLRHVLFILVLILLCVNLCGAVVLYYMEDYVVIHVMWIFYFVLGGICTKDFWGKSLAMEH